MGRVRTILVASDHSRYGRHAESRAAMLGAELNADAVEVMSVCNRKAERHLHSPLDADPANVVASDAASRGPAVAVPALFRRDAEPVQSHVPGSGAGPAAIVERANRIGADLTVTASRQENFLAGLVARLRNHELIRLSDRPVLLINREPTAAYRKVLVAVDFSAESMQAARLALAVAPTAQFTFLHAFRVAEIEMMTAHGVASDSMDTYRTRAEEAARARLNSFINSLGPRRQWIHRTAEHGVPTPVIYAHAEETSADLIAVGKHGKSRFVDLFLGSVTQRLIDYSDCDLLITTSHSEETSATPPAA